MGKLSISPNIIGAMRDREMSAIGWLAGWLVPDLELLYTRFSSHLVAVGAAVSS